MKLRPNLAADPEQEQPTRVCEIRRIPNEDHMAKCAKAIRNREHPLWAWAGFTVSQPKRLRRVK